MSGPPPTVPRIRSQLTPDSIHGRYQIAPLPVPKIALSEWSRHHWQHTNAGSQICSMPRQASVDPRANAVARTRPEVTERPDFTHKCESAWNKDPVFGVIGIQSGPPGRRVHSGFRGGYGSQVGDAGSGDAREDPSGVFRPEQAYQDDLPRVSGVAKGRPQGDPVAGDRVLL